MDKKTNELVYCYDGNFMYVQMPEHIVEKMQESYNQAMKTLLNSNNYKSNYEKRTPNGGNTS